MENTRSFQRSVSHVFDIVAGPWNEEYLLQLENFPEGKFKDMVDASANGFTEIEIRSAFSLAALTS